MSENLRSATVVMRDTSAIRQVGSWFEDAGFETDEPAPMSFSITAAPARFVEVFGTDEGNEQGELPLDGLPGDVRARVQAVAYSSIDFGPSNF